MKETIEKVLETMRSAGKPVSAGEVATLSGLDRKEVDKAFAQLKKDGAIVAPVRCKWQPPHQETDEKTSSLSARPMNNGTVC